MAITFNGTTSKLVWTGQIASARPLTIFCWIKPTSASLSRMVAGTADFGGDDESMMYADGGGDTKLKAFERKDGGSTAASSTQALVTTWQPAMVVFNTSTNRIAYYISGAGVADSTSTGANFGIHDRFAIGVRGKDDTLFFSGDIAEVTVWSSALGSTEWTSLIGGALPESVASGSLIEHWSLIDASTLTGDNGRTLTAAAASTAASHPISRGAGSSQPTRTMHQFAMRHAA